MSNQLDTGKEYKIRSRLLMILLGIWFLFAVTLIAFFVVLIINWRSDWVLILAIIINILTLVNSVVNIYLNKRKTK